MFLQEYYFLYCSDARLRVQLPKFAMAYLRSFWIFSVRKFRTNVLIIGRGPMTNHRASVIMTFCGRNFQNLSQLYCTNVTNGRNFF